MPSPISLAKQCHPEQEDVQTLFLEAENPSWTVWPSLSRMCGSKGRLEPQQLNTYQKKHINSALLYLRSASQLLTSSAPLLSADPYNEKGSILKAHQPLQLWQSISRRKAEFTWVFPREADVSLSQPIDYNGNIIKPQVYSCPERALISLVLEDLMKPNVFTTSITAVKECFYPCSQRKA